MRFFAASKELSRIANRLRAHHGATVFDQVDAVADKLSAAVAEIFRANAKLECANKNSALFLSQRNSALRERDEARAERDALKASRDRWKAAALAAEQDANELSMKLARRDAGLRLGTAASAAKRRARNSTPAAGSARVTPTAEAQVAA